MPARGAACGAALLRRHIVPFLGNVAIGKIDTAMVREWRVALLARELRRLRLPRLTAFYGQC